MLRLIREKYNFVVGDATSAGRHECTMSRGEEVATFVPRSAEAGQ